MKAYVIKNKEGKYYVRYIANSYNDSGYVEFGTLDYAAMYEKRIGAETTKEFIEKNEYKFHIKDCEVVEITIAEGDLEKQLAEKDKRIAELEDKDWYEGTIEQLEEQNGKLIKERDDNAQHIEQLLQENAQLKKEIEDLRIDLDICRNKLIVNMKEIRHQVCEEIREKLGFSINGKIINCGAGSMTGDKTILAVLDQIEQGGSK